MLNMILSQGWKNWYYNNITWSLNNDPGWMEIVCFLTQWWHAACVETHNQFMSHFYNFQKFGTKLQTSFLWFACSWTENKVKEIWSLEKIQCHLLKNDYLDYFEPHLAETNRLHRYQSILHLAYTNNFVAVRELWLHAFLWIIRITVLFFIVHIAASKEQHGQSCTAELDQ